MLALPVASRHIIMQRNFIISSRIPSCKAGFGLHLGRRGIFQTGPTRGSLVIRFKDPAQVSPLVALGFRTGRKPLSPVQLYRLATVNLPSNAYTMHALIQAYPFQSRAGSCHTWKEGRPAPRAYCRTTQSQNWQWNIHPEGHHACHHHN